ncbi:MAG: LuxR C-terminal-related transcriptional regulator [Cyanobacteria bacterium J06592_8]
MQGHRRTELTPREQEVYDLLQQGLKHKEIAQKLGISLQRVGALHRNLRLRILNRQEMQ